MIKYKLIKEFPGSEELGTVIFWDGINDCSDNWRGTEFYNKYPEYYKKIQEIVLNSGEKCFVGDDVYSVDLFNFEIIEWSSEIISDYNSDKDFIDFISLESAQNYIKFNGKKYSLNDILKAKSGEVLNNKDWIIIDLNRLNDLFSK